MSGVINAVTKPFKRLREKNKLLGTLAIAAAAWWTAGTASAYFAAPEAGLGSAMAESASNIWTTTSEFFAGSGGAPPSQASALNAQTAEFGAAGEAATTEALSAAPGAAEAGVGSLSNLATTETAAGTVAAGTPSTPGIIGRAANWMGKNPIPTMVLGQGIASAYQGHLDDKERQREDEWRKSRGLMGFNYSGNYAGPPQGIVGAPVQQQTASQAIGGPQPSMSGPQAPTIREIPRNQLPDLQNSGLINPYGGQQ